MMLKTNTWTTPILLASLMASCHGDDTALDAPGSITQMASPANVIIRNSVSKQGADVGGTADQYQRGFALPGDLDGDGFDDVIVTNSLCVHVLYGSPTWPHTVQVEQQPTLIPNDPNLSDWCGQGVSSDMLGLALPTLFRPSVAAAGDVDRDGYADFLVSYTINPSHQEGTYLVYGSPTRISGRQPIDAIAPEFAGVGGRVNGVGDINGDGYADLAAASTDDDDVFPAASTPSALVFFGSANRFSGQVSASQAGASVSIPNTTNYFVPVLRGVGDLNGDGYSDLALAGYSQACASYGSSDPSCIAQVWLVPGGKNLTGSLSLSAAPLVEGIAAHGFMYGAGTFSDTFVSALGDLDGDGFDDLAFTIEDATQPSSTYSTNILYGRADLFAQTNSADATFSGMVALASADVDGDGILDLVAGDPSVGDSNGVVNDGAVYVRLGTYERLAGSVEFSQGSFRMAGSLPAGVAAEGVGSWLAAGADVDGDGLGDILVGATITAGTDPRSMISSDPATNTGHAYLVRGAALKRTLGR